MNASEITEQLSIFHNTEEEEEENDDDRESRHNKHKIKEKKFNMAAYKFVSKHFPFCLRRAFDSIVLVYRPKVLFQFQLASSRRVGIVYVCKRRLQS